MLYTHKIFIGLSAMMLFVCMSMLCCTPPTKQANASKTPFQKVSHTENDIAPLLKRNEAIGTKEEQTKVYAIFTELQLAILKNPQEYRNRLQLAQLYMLEARATGEHGYYYPAALKVLDDMLDEKPNKDVVFGATSLKASVYLSLHKFAEAKELARFATELNGFNALIYGSLVDAHVELGEYEDAIKMADKMVSIRPDLRSYSRISYLREIHGDLDGAIAAMNEAVKAGYPGYEETAWTRLTLGELYEQKGDLASARFQYETALAERPNYPFATAALAGIAVKEGKLAEATGMLHQATNVIPEVGFYIQLLDIYKAQEDQANYEKSLSMVFEMLADDEAKGHNMGLEYARLHLEHTQDLGKALDYAQKEYDARPKNIDVNQLMAEIYYEMGKIEQARSYLKVAKSTNKQHPDLLELAAKL
ncbi:MAG: tetratricopeptide repeat protein [Bacteroidota bacterium]